MIEVFLKHRKTFVPSFLFSVGIACLSFGVLAKPNDTHSQAAYKSYYQCLRALAEVKGQGSKEFSLLDNPDRAVVTWRRQMGHDCIAVKGKTGRECFTTLLFLDEDGHHRILHAPLGEQLNGFTVLRSENKVTNPDSAKCYQQNDSGSAHKRALLSMVRGGKRICFEYSYGFNARGVLPGSIRVFKAEQQCEPVRVMKCWGDRKQRDVSYFPMQDKTGPIERRFLEGILVKARSALVDAESWTPEEREALYNRANQSCSVLADNEETILKVNSFKGRWQKLKTLVEGPSESGPTQLTSPAPDTQSPAGR